MVSLRVVSCNKKNTISLTEQSGSADDTLVSRIDPLVDLSVRAIKVLVAERFCRHSNRDSCL